MCGKDDFPVGKNAAPEFGKNFRNSDYHSPAALSLPLSYNSNNSPHANCPLFLSFFTLRTILSNHNPPANALSALQPLRKPGWKW